MPIFRAGAAPAALLRTALALSAAGAALSAATGTAAADEVSDTVKLVSGPVMTGTQYAVRPISRLPLDPLAQTGVDPLTNGVSTRIADFKPVGTQALTKPLTDGDSLSQLPVVGQVAKVVTGR